MKLERETAFGHITPGHKPDNKPFDYNDLSLDSTGLKSGSIAKEVQNGSLCDFKDSEKDAAQLLYLMKDGDSLAASKLDSIKKVNDLKTHKEYQVEEFVVPFTKSSVQIDLLEKGSNYYTDKTVMECELPELQVCYKESSYSSVKDICIDEGVPSQDKILFGNGESKKDLCTFVFPDGDENEQHNKEQMDISIPCSNGLKSSAKNQSDKEFVNDCESKDFMLRGEVKYEATCKIENDVSKDKIFPENSILMRELGMENPHSWSSRWDDNASAQVQTSSDNASETTQKVNMPSDVAVEKSHNSSEEAMETPHSVSAADETSSSHDNHLSYNSKVESSAHDFDSLASVTIAKEECSQNGISDCLAREDVSPADDGMVDMQIVSSQVELPVTITREEHPENGVCGRVETPNMIVEDGTSETQTVPSKTQQELARVECSQNGVIGSCETPNSCLVNDGISESHNVSSQVEHVLDKEESPRSSDAGGRKSRDTPIFEDGIFGAQTASGQFHYSQGESSFSAVGPLSGRINYSGPIPYSGSVSLRSDSSTTSTRSFAFPILQSEWNSSPVRMAKADRRHSRKHGGWRQGLLCCRF
ncbi:hypothetical protein PanWU01x14_010080 [Parasponia andersonii]|uniref:18S pre-ribosomal assembly protein gar2-like protein n=1 Tax=Parasponia andersonii TaxID=3476 RepID=A0A2P5E2K5_PARAD|nr:hypothetical protein PanWU01x14_010080 [Parasponia andersonii]